MSKESAVGSLVSRGVPSAEPHNNNTAAPLLRSVSILYRLGGEN